MVTPTTAIKNTCLDRQTEDVHQHTAAELSKVIADPGSYNILVSGAGSSDCNGLYTPTGIDKDKNGQDRHTWNQPGGHEHGIYSESGWTLSWSIKKKQRHSSIH